jgi:hypothetical protein
MRVGRMLEIASNRDHFTEEAQQLFESTPKFANIPEL